MVGKLMEYMVDGYSLVSDLIDEDSRVWKENVLYGLFPPWDCGRN